MFLIFLQNMAFQSDQRIKVQIITTLGADQIFRLLSDSDINIVMKTLGLLRNVVAHKSQIGNFQLIILTRKNQDLRNAWPLASCSNRKTPANLTRSFPFYNHDEFSLLLKSRRDSKIKEQKIIRQDLIFPRIIILSYYPISTNFRL